MNKASIVFIILRKHSIYNLLAEFGDAMREQINTFEIHSLPTQLRQTHSLILVFLFFFSRISIVVPNGLVFVGLQIRQLLSLD